MNHIIIFCNHNIELTIMNDLKKLTQRIRNGDDLKKKHHKTGLKEQVGVSFFEVVDIDLGPKIHLSRYFKIPTCTCKPLENH